METAIVFIFQCYIAVLLLSMVLVGVVAMIAVMLYKKNAVNKEKEVAVAIDFFKQAFRPNHEDWRTHCEISELNSTTANYDEWLKERKRLYVESLEEIFAYLRSKGLYKDIKFFSVSPSGYQLGVVIKPDDFRLVDVIAVDGSDVGKGFFRGDCTVEDLDNLRNATIRALTDKVLR